MVIRYGNISLVEWDPATDMSVLEKLANDEIAARLGPHYPFNRRANKFDREKAEVYMQSSDTKKNYAIALDDQKIGGTGVIKDTKDCWDIHCWIGQKYQGKGIGPDSLKLMTILTFDTIDISIISASVYNWNERSNRMMIKSGYKFRRKQQRKETHPTFDTEHIYSISRNDYDHCPMYGAMHNEAKYTNPEYMLKQNK